jgi:hypothetical protein
MQGTEALETTMKSGAKLTKPIARRSGAAIFQLLLEGFAAAGSAWHGNPLEQHRSREDISECKGNRSAQHEDDGCDRSNNG